VPRLPNTSPQTRLVLASLVARPADWTYGYDLSRRTGLKSGTLYPILVRLAEQGWVEARWTDAERPGRPPRHTYRLTAEGTRAVALLLADRPSERPVLRPRHGVAGA
jgi:PadR family transcriptional regulator PadR